MIAKLSGKIVAKEEGFLVIETAGIGYKVFASTGTLSEIGNKKEISLWTHLVVRENIMDLYGFTQKEEKEFFELLIAISGIGPKSALAILSLAPVSVLRKAISSNDASYLTKVSGIGKKSAQKIILELSGKVGKSFKGDEVGLKEEAETLEALQALGYTLGEAREALKKVPTDATGTSERIKATLKILGNGLNG